MRLSLANMRNNSSSSSSSATAAAAAAATAAAAAAAAAAHPTRARRGGAGDDNCHWQPELCPAVSASELNMGVVMKMRMCTDARDCNACVASRRRYEPAGSLLRARGGHVTDSSELERSAGLQRVHLGPDLRLVSARTKLESVGLT